MSMLDGVSQCWWLSDACTVNWEAWSAVGTVFAALVALGLGAHAYLRGRSVDGMRKRIATGVCRVLAVRLYEEANALGVNRGVSRGQWDDDSITFVERTALALGKSCREIEKYLLDLEPSTGDALAEVITRSRGLSEDITAFDKHDMKTKIIIASLVTQNTFAVCKEIMDTETMVMPMLGGAPDKARLPLDEWPRHFEL